MTATFQTFSRCGVCGFAEVLSDEVWSVGGGDGRPALGLGACPRCDHRWTVALPQFAPRVVRAPRWLGREWGSEAA